MTKNIVDDTTFVTMSFDIGMIRPIAGYSRSKETNYKDYYVKSLISLAKCIRNLIVFCDHECAVELYNSIKEQQNHIKIYEMEVIDLYPMRFLDKNRAAMRHMAKEVIRREKMHYPKQIRMSCVVNPKYIEEGTIYNTLVQAKPYLMAKAAKENPFNSEYFYWIDAGILNDRYAFVRENWDSENIRILHKPKGIRFSLYISNKEMRFWPIAKYLWTNKNLAYGFIPSQASAAIWGGELINVLNFAKIFEEIQMKLLKHNITSGEQGIMTIITRKYPDIVDIPITLRGSKCAINDVLNCDESVKLWGRGAIKGFFA